MKYCITCLFVAMMGILYSQGDIISYEKGPCMGKCPVFSISVSDNMEIVFEGIRHTDFLGRFSRKLTKKEFRKVMRKFRKAKIHQLQKSYDERLMDASLTKIMFQGKGIESQTQYKITVPSKKLKRAVDYLLSLTPLYSAAPFEKQTLHKPSNNRAEDKNPVVQGRKEGSSPTLLVELKSNVHLDQWIQNYKEYDLTKIKNITPNRPLFLLKFDPRTTNTKAIIALLQADLNVVNVQTNKKITLR